MEKGGRGGQRVACVCLSPRVCERERRRGMIAHTPTSFCFPPPDTPAELGRSWAACLVPLTPAHTDLSTFWPLTSRPDPTSAHALPVSSKCFQRRQKAERRRVLSSMLGECKGMFTLRYGRACFCMLICLHVSDRPPWVRLFIHSLNWLSRISHSLQAFRGCPIPPPGL